MDITPIIPRGKQVLTGYGNGQFKVAGEVYPHSILIFPDRTVKWDMTPQKNITLESLNVVVEEEGEIDLLVIGCTRPQMSIPQGVRTALKEAGIALEIMDTGAAARTYNVLLAEGRRVAAALVVV